MKTDIIHIDNRGTGFDRVAEEAIKAALYRGLDGKQTRQLQLLAEEMLSMAHSITGELEASFWIESEGTAYEAHMTTNTVMDKEKRYLLISASTSKKNEAANSFLGKLRDAFENAMASEVEHTYFDLPEELRSDISGYSFEDQVWDGYECSVLRKLADNIKIFIRGKEVHMIVAKQFA